MSVNMYGIYSQNWGTGGKDFRDVEIGITERMYIQADNLHDAICKYKGVEYDPSLLSGDKYSVKTIQKIYDAMSEDDWGDTDEDFDPILGGSYWSDGEPSSETDSYVGQNEEITIKLLTKKDLQSELIAVQKLLNEAKTNVNKVVNAINLFQ